MIVTTDRDMSDRLICSRLRRNPIGLSGSVMIVDGKHALGSKTAPPCSD
jgi:hypothetical protein